MHQHDDLLDHRELNQDLHVFGTDPLAGSGLPLWLPAGSAIRDELERLAGTGLSASPVHEVLIEESVLGWKEFELELMRGAGRIASAAMRAASASPATGLASRHKAEQEALVSEAITIGA